MPTLLRVGGCRIHIYSNDHEYPEHVHVDTGNCLSVWNLKPLKCVRQSSGCGGNDLQRVRKLIQQNIGVIWEKWHEVFRKRK